MAKRTKPWKRLSKYGRLKAALAQERQEASHAKRSAYDEMKEFFDAKTAVVQAQNAYLLEMIVSLDLSRPQPVITLGYPREVAKAEGEV